MTLGALHLEKRTTQGRSSYLKEKTANLKYKKRLKCKYLCVCCVVSNNLVCKSSDCLVTVVKHKSAMLES